MGQEQFLLLHSYFPTIANLAGILAWKSIPGTKNESQRALSGAGSTDLENTKSYEAIRFQKTSRVGFFPSKTHFQVVVHDRFLKIHDATKTHYLVSAKRMFQ